MYEKQNHAIALASRSKAHYSVKPTFLSLFSAYFFPLFFFLAACALAGIQAEQWLLKVIFWRYRTVPMVLVYLIQTSCLCKDSPFCKTVSFSYLSEF